MMLQVMWGPDEASCRFDTLQLHCSHLSQFGSAEPPRSAWLASFTD
jgi:hypothetical protein